MLQYITFSQFCDAFSDMHRENNFSYDAKKALYDFLEEESPETYTLDVIALCCAFTEYADLKEFQVDYGEEYKSIDAIADATLVIPIDKESFIIQQF